MMKETHGEPGGEPTIDSVKDEEIERLEKSIQEDSEQKKAKEIALKKAAVDEWKIEQEKAKRRAKEAQKIKDKEFRERLRDDFGYRDEEIEKILDKETYKKEHKHKKHDTINEEKKETWIKV
jgi:hypothetical protein